MTVSDAQRAHEYRELYWEAEARAQKAEARAQKAEARAQKAEARAQKAEARVVDLLRQVGDTHRRWFERGGESIAGPFTTHDDALTARDAIEKLSASQSFWITSRLLLPTHDEVVG